MAANLSVQEVSRLKALNDARLLDTPIHYFFERITALAQRIFDAPVAAVSLIDENRQWFKSIRGCDLQETQRDVSFCTHAILNESVMVINDAQNDPVFKNNPLVCGEPGIRFYAGYPIHTEDHQAIGTLCLIDQKPRLFTEREKLILKDLVGMLETEIKRISHQEDYQLIFEARQQTAECVDKVTRLWNTKGLNLLFNHYFEYGRTGQRDFALVKLSIDNFNTFSIENGEEAKNRMLTHIAQTLVQLIDPGDIIGYWGGKEFMLIINSPSAEKIANLASLLVNHASREGFSSGHLQFKTTFSTGSVVFNREKHTSLKSLLNGVHNALAECKKSSSHLVSK